MASLTAAQRAKIPRSEWAIHPGQNRARWAYPMPSRATAKRIGISEAQRQRILRNAAARSAQRATRGSFGRIAPAARRKASPAGGGRRWGTTAKPRRKR